MYKIIVVTQAEGIGKDYCEELKGFFNEDLLINYITWNDDNIKSIYNYDMILISSYNIISRIREYINPQSKVIKIVKNIRPEGLSIINDIPYGSDVLVVNIGPKTTSESIYLIYAHGRTDLNLYPYYPGIAEYPDLDIVVTQGEKDIYKKEGINVIDIFNTVIDGQVFLEIILYFELNKDKYLNKLMEKNIVRNNSDSFSYMMSEKFLQDNIINALYENMNEGVLIYNDTRKVTSCSSITQKFLNTPKKNIIGRKIDDILAIENFPGNEGPKSSESIININKQVYICRIIPKIKIGIRNFGIVILKRYNEAELKMYQYKQELIEQGYRSKYSINNIIGTSDIMKILKEKCLRLAKSDATVLIIGETGTGKELFAHVIHNHSFRNDKQFVAVNCASIPESLLESELFGYEEGSFTGAVKGGKKGIFEKANGGTLFLDEISEIPLHLQNRLLRVLQEKEVTRIGGSRIIEIDTRVIAATNIDLKKKVQTGSFRKDLFYRISVLPLTIPPLRDRGNDVLEIFYSICEKNNSNNRIRLTSEVEEYFLQYEWDGNIRELINCYEYLSTLDKSEISYQDLPETMKNSQYSRPTDPRLNKECLSVNDTILEIILNENSKNRNLGRKKISEMLAKKHIFLGEQEVRKELMLLEDKGLVEIKGGRGGTRITNSGIEYLRKQQNCI